MFMCITLKQLLFKLLAILSEFLMTFMPNCGLLFLFLTEAGSYVHLRSDSS